MSKEVRESFFRFGRRHAGSSKFSRISLRECRSCLVKKFVRTSPGSEDGTFRNSAQRHRHVEDLLQDQSLAERATPPQDTRQTCGSMRCCRLGRDDRFCHQIGALFGLRGCHRERWWGRRLNRSGSLHRRTGERFDCFEKLAETAGDRYFPGSRCRRGGSRLRHGTGNGRRTQRRSRFLKERTLFPRCLGGGFALGAAQTPGS